MKYYHYYQLNTGELIQEALLLTLIYMKYKEDVNRIKENTVCIFKVRLKSWDKQ